MANTPIRLVQKHGEYILYTFNLKYLVIDIEHRDNDDSEIEFYTYIYNPYTMGKGEGFVWINSEKPTMDSVETLITQELESIEKINISKEEYEMFYNVKFEDVI